MVWFVEDDRNDVFLIERALRRYTPPLSARFAASLEQLKAMTIVAMERNTLPSVIVTDLKLTGETGFSVIEWIRSHAALSSIRLVVLTSSPLFDDQVRATALGVDGFIIKPTGHNLPELLESTLRPLCTVPHRLSPATSPTHHITSGNHNRTSFYDTKRIPTFAIGNSEAEACSEE